MPAIISFNVNVPDDTRLAGFGLNAITNQMAPLDANGNTSLRAVVEWGNANPQNGDWTMNRIEANLAMIAGGTITLTQNTTLELDTNFRIFVNPGPVTIERSAAPNTPAFNHFAVSANTESHFEGLTLKNGSSPFDGGSIRNSGKVQAMSCTFTDNFATTDGGAISTRFGATTYLFSCTFTNNKAAGYGGAVAAQPGSLATNLDTCTLTGNEAVLGGGAVSAVGANSFSISGSSITQNKATGANQGQGGGVYVQDTSSPTIGNTGIDNNTAAFQGGGLFVLRCDLTMNYGSLSSNTAAQDGGGFYIDEGLYAMTATLTSVRVTDNTATAGKGGGGYLKMGTLSGSLSALTGNTSGVAGFAGIAWKSGSTANITVPPGQQTVVNDP